MLIKQRENINSKASTKLQTSMARADQSAKYCDTTLHAVSSDSLFDQLPQDFLIDLKNEPFQERVNQTEDNRSKL